MKPSIRGWIDTKIRGFLRLCPDENMQRIETGVDKAGGCGIVELGFYDS